MKQFIYLSVTPESLIASHLPPIEFGNYLAVGTKKRIRGQAIFFEVDPEKLPDIPTDYINERLIPYKDGEPKRSLYLSIYRVFERVPLKALRNLYLVTYDGKVLELMKAVYEKEKDDLIHLYQQFNPITTRVASKLTPPEFISFLTDTKKPVSAPRIFIAELRLNDLAINPAAPIHDLPYPNPDHLRECLARLMETRERVTKTVLRQFRGDLPYRTVRPGFFIGDHKGFLYFPIPSPEEMEKDYYSWWRSALNQCY